MSALLTALALWLAGHTVIGLASALGAQARRERGPFELHATAWLLGAAVLPLAAFHAVWWFGPLPRAAGLALLALAAAPGALLVTRHHRAARAADGQRPPWSGLQRFGAAVLAAFCLFALFAAASVPMHGFDATFHYAYKAKLLFHEGFGTAAWTDLEGAVGRTMTHPTYPPLVPALELLVAWVRGGYDDDAARPLMALFALAPAGLLIAALRSRGRGVALLGGLAWMTLPLLYYWRLPRPGAVQGVAALFTGPAPGPKAVPWTRPPNWCLDGTADLPLAVFLLAAFLPATRLVRGRSDRLDLIAAGLFAAAALTVKNEGSALVAVLAVALVLGRFGGGAWRGRALLGASALAALASAGWFVARAGLPNVDEDYPGRLAPARLVDSLGRVGEVAARFARTLIDVTMWNLTWPLLFAAVVWALARRRVSWGSPACTALLVIAGGVSAYALVLVVTPWNLALLETTGIPMRLLLHLTPLAVFATFALIFDDTESGQKSPDF